MAVIEVIGDIYEDNGYGSQGGRVYSTKGIAPAIGASHFQQVKYIVEAKQICAMRGRNPENPNDRRKGINLEQRLEPNTEGICNTLTTVDKDNLVVIRRRIVALTEDDTSNEHEYSVLVKQATKEGFIECDIGGVADLNYPTSETRRGRVQGNGQICPTLTTENIPNRIELWLWQVGDAVYQLAIRKLTPNECWRLMDFTDEDFHKAESVCSNSQLYKQAGNSIVKNVLMAVFGQMIPGKENAYADRFSLCMNPPEE